MRDPEFSRLIRARPSPPERTSIEANEIERQELAARFEVVAIELLHAELAFEPDGDAVLAKGALTAEVIQTCAVSGDDFSLRIEEPVSLLFVRQASTVDPDEEAELPGDEPDEIEFSGEMFDIGEAVAQTLGLVIDPFAEGPNADTARVDAGLIDEDAPRGPLAEALAQLTRS